MLACPVTTHPSNRRLNIYLGWSFIINVERGEVSLYGPARGVCIFPLVQVSVVSRQSLYRRFVDGDLMRVGTTTSLSIMNLQFKCTVFSGISLHLSTNEGKREGNNRF